MQLAPIHLDKINETFPYLKDKMVIDFVNGLDVANRLNQHQKEVSQSFFKRNFHILNGKTQMAQENINDHVIAGLEACQGYFQEISQHQQAHANAIMTLNTALSQTQNNVAEIAHFVADLQEQVQEINHQLSSRIDRLEWSDRADRQLQNVLSAWEAEQYVELSPMGQCFLVLDTLKWGDFGLFLQQLNPTEREQELNTLKNKIITIQKSLLHKNATDDFLKKQWLEPTAHRASTQDMQYALQYQGDWSWKNPKHSPMVFTATQLPMLTENVEEYDDLVIEMIDINRVSQRMMQNIFVA
ncbi:MULTISPECIES: diguanylate cyclase regulator RdcB family protein [unclassified Moraxella]|uniref:diguanylate cyclase regulator RdcB family protein n=1 Tax=unclassified Moraxella TaxID=2685852 RepID=UPI003AF8916B